MNQLDLRFVFKEQNSYSSISTCVGPTGTETSTSVEHEKYFSSIVAATPIGNQHFDPSTSDSLSSLDSLMLSAASGEPLSLPDTPDSARKNPLARAVSSLRSSGGKVKCKHSRTLSVVGASLDLLCLHALLCHCVDFNDDLCLQYLVVFMSDAKNLALSEILFLFYSIF